MYTEECFFLNSRNLGEGFFILKLLDLTKPGKGWI